MICEGPTADELCSVGWCIYVFNLDFTHLCLDIPVPSINKDFIIIIIVDERPNQHINPLCHYEAYRPLGPIFFWLTFNNSSKIVPDYHFL